MKHKFSLGLILFLALLLLVQIVQIHSKKKKSSKKGKKSSSSKKAYTSSLPLNFKINQDSYIAASILKTLGVKLNLESIIIKFQRNCKGLKMVKSINNSIKTIQNLTRKSNKKAFKIAKKQFKSMFGKRRRNRPSPFSIGNMFGGKGIFGGSKIKNSFDSFKSKAPKVKTSGKKKGKFSKLKKICQAKGFYNAAVSKLKGTKAKLRAIKKKKLIRVIKRTLRRLLARILGCDFVRTGSLAKIVRKTVKKITTKRIKANVFNIAKMLKKISKNYKRKPRNLKKARKVLRNIFSKLVRGKKIKPMTVILIKKMAISNCKAADLCYKKNIFSRKCFEVSKLCLNMKSIVKKVRANRVGVVVSGLIKNLFKK
jgi:hypothetical protein